VSDVNGDPVQRELVEILKHSSIILADAGMLELKPILQRFLADLHQVGPGDRALVYRLANLADGRIRAVLGSGPAALSVDFLFSANATVTASGGLTMAPMGMFGNTITTVPLPADTIRKGAIRQYDLNYVAAVLLAVIAWLLTFSGPVMISKLPQADQSAMTDYYSGIPGLALMLTSYLITHRPKGK
jgi:hypothetical protein